MYKKRLTAIGLAMAMTAASLAGCGNGAGTGQTSTTGGNSAQTQGGGSETAGSETGTDNARITIMTIDHNGSPLTAEGSDEVKKRVEEHTGTIIDDSTFTWVPNDTYTEKMGLTLLNKDNMPMILTVNGPVNSTIVQAANAGAFWDLSDYIFDEEKYPNLSKMNQDVAKQVMVNGELIGIYRARAVGRNGFGYRQDWADALGLKTPETLEDIYNMAYAFTYDDPDGNGIKDTYGFSFSKSADPLDILQTIFGCGNKWVEKDGELVPTHLTDEYMEALDWLKKMYDDGLVYEDWAVREKSTATDAVKNGECGMMSDVLDESRRVWDYFINSEIPAVTGEGFASMTLVGAIKKDASSEKTILATSGMNGFFAITKAASEADLENCLHFLDKMCDEEMILLADYGMEGVTYEFNAEGELVSSIQGVPLNLHPQNGLNQTIAYIPNLLPATTKIDINEGRAMEYAAREANIPYCVFNPASAYLNNSETYSMNGGNLDEIIKRARTQYICGEIDESGLKAQFEEWSIAGGAKVIEEVNTQHKAQ